MAEPKLVAVGSPVSGYTVYQDKVPLGTIYKSCGFWRILNHSGFFSTRKSAANSLIFLKEKENANSKAING